MPLPLRERLVTPLLIGWAALLIATGVTHDQAIASHDNREPAGALRDGVLTLQLHAGSGTWFPTGTTVPGRQAFAFGEEGQPLSIPGPAIRVPAGTRVEARIRNTIADSPLTVHGLHDRPGDAAIVEIPPGGTRQVTFTLTTPGTYYYWASTTGARALATRYGAEAQLSGVLIVDGAEGQTDEHVLVLGVEETFGATPIERHLEAAAINGRSWPHTTQSTLTVGDTVRMRWINATSRPHPIHLHGFYFTVHGKGDLSRDTLYAPGDRRLAVTEFLAPGQTMTVSWVAEREGNWLMHCHMVEHMSPRLRGTPAGAAHEGHAGTNHTMEVMSGLVTGWRVRAAPGAEPRATSPAPVHSLRLHVHHVARANGVRAMGFMLQTDTAAPSRDSVPVPGTPIVLTQGEPVEIRVLNHLDEATSVHWHGIELESYFDGVSGWSGVEGSLSPAVAPGDSFMVRFTPPRAGTFIYHSHFSEDRQLAAGMYGALLVLPPGTRFDPATDHSWVVGHVDPAARIQPGVNGSRRPQLDLEAGRTHRIRIININPNLPFILELVGDSVPERWRAVAKDGADLPPRHASFGPARVRLGVGETADFEYTTPASSRTLRLRLVDPQGRSRLEGEVRVIPPG